MPLQPPTTRLVVRTGHTDYTIRPEGLRTISPYAEYSWDQVDHVINGALAYHTAFSFLYELQIKSSGEPTRIPLPEYFSHAPGEWAVTMVREDHGLIGLKDAWTLEEISRGKIPFCIGRFTTEENRMHDADPTRALFPTVADRQRPPQDPPTHIEAPRGTQRAEWVPDQRDDPRPES